MKRWWLGVLSHTLNPLTRRLARAGRGPFALVRHVGRKSGRTYETPLILARVPEGFVAELTYGPEVDWFRNVVAAGGCVVVAGGAEHRVDGVTTVDREDGLRAFGFPASVVLRLLRRGEFRLLHAG
ncbi:nitroreductase family deazaflavin-dependent oxidoreductase [Pseudonocardia ailaonensis]|uniref:nitroreductase family deazaflavin-dependent oxidoreductase n=1 Tax=Pseudonocardia ailaonensis TaxID=367279 RepID=UPI0031D0A991